MRIEAELLGQKHIQMTMARAHLARGYDRSAVEQPDAYNKGSESVILKAKGKQPSLRLKAV